MNNKVAKGNLNTGGERHTSDLRIGVLGKTGAGKSELCNTILREDVFPVGHTSTSETSRSQRVTRHVNGRRITLIDSPGLFDTNMSEEELRSEIMRCMIAWAPGIHAFLIVLKVERFTEQDNQIVDKIKEHVGEEAFKHAVVVFTHGNELAEGTEILEFVGQNEKLNDLLKKCSYRCHVIDNKYWRNNQQDEYRNNEVQVERLINTIQVMTGREGVCTNEMLQDVKRRIEQEVQNIRQSSPDLSEEEVRHGAEAIVFIYLKRRLAGVSTKVLKKALFGVCACVSVVIAAYGPGSRFALAGVVALLQAVYRRFF